MLLGIYAVLLLIGLYIIFLRIEKINHERRVRSIPVRIWVNGSRGKSSVTRLIAAGLRGGGKKVIAKTTGTKASFIHDSQHEQPVTRLGMPNIREQVDIFRKAAKEKPDAIVLECMALRPDLQYSEAVQIVKPNAVVITNVRADHLDVMGPSTKDIGRYFLNALPKNVTVFLGNQSILPGHESILQKKGAESHISDENRISNTQLSDFPYIEHKANLAIALDVCKYFGVDEKCALAAMCTANPDPGVLRRYRIRLGTKEIMLFNAMAANDPDSTYVIWQMIDKDYPQMNILINCRDDRVDRSFQMAELVRDRLKGDYYILTGRGTEVLARKLSRVVDQGQILDLGNMNPAEVIEKISGFVADKSLVFAMGNTVGYGEELMHEFLVKRE
jgi:poly-gamma-glutamate synthase PgsB/CapB